MIYDHKRKSGDRQDLLSGGEMESYLCPPLVALFVDVLDLCFDSFAIVGH